MSEVLRRTAVALATALALVGCGDGAPETPTDAGGEAALVERGRKVYMANCTACHAADPLVAGPVGPPLAGSDLELLRAKVLRGEYPPGYVPRRDSRAMVPLPHVEPDLPAIAAWLAEAEG